MLQPAERNSCVHEQEGLAIKWACETFRPFLTGTHFIVETDHQSLTWLMKATSPARLVRWALILGEFDFEIKFKQIKNLIRMPREEKHPLKKMIVSPTCSSSTLPRFPMNFYMMIYC